MKSRLKVLLAEKDMTQQDLIRDLKLGSHTVSKLVNNTFQRIDVTTINVLLDYFNCPLEGRDGLFIVEEVQENG